MELREKKKGTLDGKTWLRYSIGLWDDIEKNPVEKDLKHPTMHPPALVERLLDCYLWHQGVVLLLEVGKHFIVTKPMEVTLEGTDAMVEAEERNKRLLLVDFDMGYLKGAWQIHQAVVDGLFGKLILLSVGSNGSSRRSIKLSSIARKPLLSFLPPSLNSANQHPPTLMGFQSRDTIRAA